MANIAAIIYAVLMGIVILFQASLALGAPWGAASMGGKYPGKYPPKMRIIALVNMIVLGFLTLIVLIRADILLPQFRPISVYAIWFVVAFSAVSVVLNTITPSRIERIWAPVAAVQLVAGIVVAIY